MGCASSKPRLEDDASPSAKSQAELIAANFKVARPKKTMIETVVAALSPLDDRILEVLGSGDIRLVRSEWFVLQPEGYHIQRRQELEILEKAGAVPSPLLSADEAVALVRKCNRGAAALSYGWLSSEHPDPLGHRVGELRTALISLTHIAGFFWDFASLPQNPRTDEEDEAFRRALVVMGDLYSSPCGLSVLQIRHIPPRPLDFAGMYNDRAFDERGWCVFEDAVVTSLLCRLRALPKLQAILDTLPPKLFVQDEGSLEPRELNDDVSVASFTVRLQAAKFTGKGDEVVVVNLFKSEYVERYAMRLQGILGAMSMSAVWWNA